MKKLLIIMTLFLMSFNTNAQELKISFKEHIQNLKTELAASGHDASVLDELFNGSFIINKRIKKSFTSQPEVKATFDSYVTKKLSNWRISNGRKKYLKHKEFLKTVEAKYNVPGEIVVALWGVETNYGTYPLKNNAIKALVNLSYIHPNPKRRSYFKSELFAAMKLIKRFNFDPKTLAGSWAGALGQCQFMPSNVLAYAVDGNNDGKIDIWNTEEDVLASSANFINKLGWNNTLKGYHQGQIPKNFKIYQKRAFKTLKSWNAEAVVLKDKTTKLASNTKLKLFAPINKDKKVYLTSKNFDVIKRWNNSNYFAFSVLALADEIKKTK